MKKIKITGGKPLQGEVKVSGAKNCIAKLLVASLLSDQPCYFSNVPDIEEVKLTVSLCREIGMNVAWDREKGEMEVCTPELRSAYIPQKYCGANRIPILMIGALLSRTEEDIIVPTVGGDNIGERPINFHLDALRALGADIEYRSMKKEGAYFARAHQGLRGRCIELPYPSVGATENTLLAAVSAKGTTIIRNAAMEPEIIDLILFLQKLGARIALKPNSCIQIQETKKFYPTHHRVITDRIAAASFGIAAIATKGRVFVRGAQQETLVSFLDQLRNIGGGFEVKPDGIEFFHCGKLRGNAHIETGVYPEFMTDCQQPFVVLLTQTEGISIVHETVHENRFGYVKTLKEMGADATLLTSCLGDRSCRYGDDNFLHSLLVRGPTPLQGFLITIPDLRAGFAYIMAGLIASGESILEGISYLYRGYEHPIEKLQSLGADISLISHAVQKKKNRKDVSICHPVSV